MVFEYILMGIGVLNIIEYFSLKSKGKFSIYLFNNYIMNKTKDNFLGKIFFSKERMKRSCLSGGIAAIVLGFWLIF